MPPLFLRRVPPGLPAALGDRGRRARCTQRPRLLSALGPAAGRGAISLPTVLCPELGAWLELTAHGAQRCVPSARPVTVTFRWPGDSWRSPGVAGMAPRAGAFSRLGAPDGLPAARTPRPPQRRDAAGPRGLFLPCVLCALGRKAARCSVRARSRTLLPNDSSSCLAASVLPFCQSKVVAAPPDPIPVSAEFFWPQRWCLEPGPGLSDWDAGPGATPAAALPVPGGGTVQHFASRLCLEELATRRGRTSSQKEPRRSGLRHVHVKPVGTYAISRGASNQSLIGRVQRCRELDFP